MDNILKKDLINIEAQIIEITGHEIGNSDEWTETSQDYVKVTSLLKLRKEILNKMFYPSKENMLIFRNLNERLYHLSEMLFKRVHNLADKQHLIMDCSEFDDDYELVGTLRYVYNSDDSILKLEDDDLYGSNFNLMIKLIADSSYGTVKENIEDYSVNSYMLDDGISWNEYPFAGRREFDDIVICHAVHQLTSHQLFSIPDLLRLNDFWAEVTLTLQSITDQVGRRYNPNNIQTNETF